MLPPRLAELGMSAFIAWILTGLGAFSIGIIFIKLGEGRSDYYLHNLIASQVKSEIRPMVKYIFFWEYFLFLVLGNALLSCTVVSTLQQIFPEFIANYNLLIHALLFFIFYITNRFGIQLSEALIKLFTIIKILILIVIPFIVLCFVKPTIPIILTKNPISDVIKGMFITLLPFVGIESISMEKGFKKSDITSAMISGIFVCLLTFVLNTYVMMRNIPNLANSGSAYSDLFALVFGSQSKWILVLSILLVMLGSLHGWIHTSLSTADSGASMLPKILKHNNKHNVNEAVLVFIAIVPVLFVLLTQILIKNTLVFNTIMDSVTSLCLLIYLSGILAFIKLTLTKKKRSNWIYIICALLYLTFAIIGSPIIPTCLGVLSFVILGGIFLINENQKAIK
jgi:arginine:agmatine antiporter